MNIKLKEKIPGTHNAPMSWFIWCNVISDASDSIIILNIFLNSLENMIKEILLSITFEESLVSNEQLGHDSQNKRTVPFKEAKNRS